MYQTIAPTVIDYFITKHAVPTITTGAEGRDRPVIKSRSTLSERLLVRAFRLLREDQTRRIALAKPSLTVGFRLRGPRTI
jgi:hypothetical protein